MLLVPVSDDTFIPESVNCRLYANQNAKKQIVIYLPSCQVEKKFKFFIHAPKKILVRINNEKDSFWESDKRTLILPETPGKIVLLEEILGKWLITGNFPLTFR